MNNQEIFLTKEGLKNLKEEIKYFEEIKRKEIQNEISQALEYGDITENAEYSIALEAQRMNEINIVRLKQKLSRVKVVKEDSNSEGIGIGTTLKLKNLDSGKKLEYIFVPDDQIDFNQHKISINSPLGQAFLGYQEGEEIEIEVPIGMLRYKILKILK
ncbi:MAG: transcription elongation factor GreA [Candidatus Infernicultor aquiphilus]|uniref:Transcription elongation factor GreA n=1 Tax=Candidatus Infernicultor aquiphilus TaxID=1805029 RepID=A0A2M8CGF5_9BACT|nr:MAG: transcription elongation factor GreA [Candidatus Atribacteria bacterium CG08_land_8_20_14_0_20_33_29]PIW12675.1 MAG: transcription elongation factor GreA [Candidatus Atribacteria bacterium CG17_big_fil_post_rev_8_21_14_2_50_34_11]PIY31647.1 MAG: transcription elongation factor GreA [Candidatus Atribacteria bacterium CG_4_10_14_3_um_filter_34_13]PJB58118.1 MAG: transcription elongation factor GreA [Candidatus Atribacteria bacterium CG_4_9_14_3_um_filter_33_16]